MVLLSTLLTAALLILATALTTQSLKFWKNYKNARRTGLRILVSPLDPHGVPFMLLSAVFWRLVAKWRWARVLQPTMSWQDDFKNHEVLGSSFFVVSPARNLLVTADEGVVERVCGDRKGFVKTDSTKYLELFGRNVDSLNGADWARHRRITAPSFNEQISSAVWTESIRQCNSLLTSWISQPRGKVSTVEKDLRLLTIHVLCLAGFGTSHDFHGGTNLLTEGHSLTYRDALVVVIDLIPMVIVNQMPWLKSLPTAWLPAKLQKIFLATKEFSAYMEEMLARERRLIASGVERKDNLVSRMIMTSDRAKDEGSNSAMRLSDEEIRGNLYIFNLAGHETTASALAYACGLFAVYPEVQDWVYEEVREVFVENGDGEFVYEDVYPKLKRVLAVMYETLRIYGPVPQLPRAALNPDTPLTVRTATGESTTIVVPPNTIIDLNLHGMHTNPANFPSPTTWDPKRWITPSPSSSLSDETLKPAPAGFSPWLRGPGNCPGRKFSQVEFAAVICSILNKVRIEPCSTGGVEKGGLTFMREEVLRVIRDSALEGPAFKLRRPDDLWLGVVER